MNILFIGNYCPPEKENYIKSHSSFFDYPANVLQNSLLTGLEEFADVNIVSSIKLSNSSKTVKGFDFLHNNKSRGVVIDCHPSLIYKKLFGGREISSWAIKNFSSPPDCIILYSYSLELLKSVEKLKKHFPNSIVIMIVTDLSVYMSAGGHVRKLLKSIESHICNRIIKKYVNGYIFLSERMKDCFTLQGKQYEIIEGIYNDFVIKSDINKTECNSFLYTGNLSIRYGIADLIEAFLKLEDRNVELWLCGEGDAVPYIETVIKKDSRIKYFGQVDRNKVLELQRQASFLVNPRHSNEEFTKYSFPSKTLEYLASGTPTVMCRLKCIPKEYSGYIYYFEDESIDGMSKTMHDLCSKNRSELLEFGKRASEFILSEKTPKKQCAKIIRLYNNCNHVDI